MLLDETYILNEKFSMDNWKKKDYDKIIDEIINQDNTNFESDVANCWEIKQLDLPDSVKDLILQDFIQYEKDKDIQHSWGLPKWGDIDAWYVLTHKYARKYIEKYLMKEFKQTYHFIESLGNPMKLYRFVHFDYNRWKLAYKPQTKLSPEEMGDHILKNPNIHLGVCWTPHFDKAQDFGHQEHEIDEYCMIIEAIVPRDAVNLPNTLIKRSSFTYYHYEDEIELIKGSPIMVEHVWFPPEIGSTSDEWIDNYKHKPYKV